MHIERLTNDLCEVACCARTSLFNYSVMLAIFSYDVLTHVMFSYDVLTHMMF